jgi:hypothetical protein
MDGELLCNDGTSEVIIADGPKSRPEQRKREDDLGGRDDTGCGVSPNHAVTLLRNGDLAKVDSDGLLHNQTAGSAIACIAGWIRLHVVTKKNSSTAFPVLFDRWMHEQGRLKQVSWIRPALGAFFRGRQQRSPRQHGRPCHRLPHPLILLPQTSPPMSRSAIDDPRDR